MRGVGLQVRVQRAIDGGGAWDGKTVDEFREELAVVNDRFTKLQEVESILVKCSKVDSGLERKLLELDLKDATPPPRPRGPKKEKGPKPGITGPRKPYREYTSGDGIKILVGRTANDNDDLSLNKEHRDQGDWWLHAAGCPGSHVVIRYSDEDVPQSTVMDAALLAAKYSKAGTAKTSVTLTRCRNVSKPALAKPGLVTLSGDVRTVRVDVKANRERIERLEGTVPTAGAAAASTPPFTK